MKNRDELEGQKDQVKGRAKQAWGDLTDNERLHDEGVADEAAGDVQEGFGRARRKVGEAIDIYVNNRLVARGEVVVVDERLGVTMTEIIKDGDVA